MLKKVVPGLLVVLTVGLSCQFAHAELPFRNSEIYYRNTVNVMSFDRSKDLTYNPYYSMTLGFRPQWWFGDSMYMGASFSLTREITESDTTTLKGEIVPSDVLVSFGAPNLVKIPGVDISLSLSADASAPTSPVSRARTLMTALSGGLSLSRNFKVLKGLSFSYSGRFSKYLHRYTTWERESSLIPACPAGDTGCDAFLNTGVRNSNMRHSHSFSAGMGILSWLSFSTSFGLIYDHLYDSTGDEGTSFTPQEPQDTRYLMQHGLALSFKPMASMGIVLGVNTTWPQLASDSTYRTPLYNRYSVIYLDLKLDVAGLVSQLTPNEEKHVSN